MTVELELDMDVIEETIPDDDITVVTGFSTEYAAYVNYGTEAHWPPLTPMVKWTERMGWENYNLETSDSEDELWDKVDERQNSNEPLPAAYLMARHISQHGTEAMMYASDAFDEAVMNGESWMESQGYHNEDPEQILLDFANWTLELATQNIVDRVSPATTGKLIQSGIQPQVDND